MSTSASGIMGSNAKEDKAENAQMIMFVGATAIGDLVKSTLGPFGMDKIIQPIDSRKDILVTNDGATILKSIHIDNPSAKILVEISKVQDDEIGDGTTTVCVLASELLRGSEFLIQRKVHPNVIASSYSRAAEIAIKALERGAISDQQPENFRRILLNVASTTLGSKFPPEFRPHFAEIAVRAVERLAGSGDLKNILILKKPGGRLVDSFIDDGFIIDKLPGTNQPRRLTNASILLANTPMDTDKVKVFSSRVRVEGTAELAALERAEREKMHDKVTRIKNHKINVFINRQLIYNYPEQLFADAGIMAIEHADFEGIERLAHALDAEIVSTFDTPDTVKLGRCDLIEEITIGEEKMMRFSGLPRATSCTIVLRGSSEPALDEMERSLHDTLCVLVRTMAEPSIVCGGGCAESMMAAAVECASEEAEPRHAMCYRAFARALRQLPATLAENAGLDATDLVGKLRTQHLAAQRSNVQCNAGLNLSDNCIADMFELGVQEPLALKRSVVSAGAQAAAMISRIDNVLRCRPRERTQ